MLRLASELDDMKNNKEQIDRIQAIEESSRSDTDNNILIEAFQNEESFMKAFESKVIMYLFEDVMKMRAERNFIGHAQKNGKMIFSEICKAFEQEGEKIFGNIKASLKHDNIEGEYEIILVHLPIKDKKSLIVKMIETSKDKLRSM